MAGVEKLFGGHILDKSGEEVDLKDEKYKGKVIGLYFSAHWYVFILLILKLIFVLGVHHVVILLQF